MHPGRTPVILVTLLMTLMGVPSGHAGTLVVGSGGYGTIASALAAAAPGDLVLVDPGIYNESLTIATHGVAIKGSGPGVIIQGSGAYAVKVAADHARLERLEIRGGTDAVFADGVNALTIDDVHITASTGNGFELRNVTGFVMRDSSATGVPAGPVRFTDVDAADVVGLSATGGQRGIHLIDSSGAFEDLRADSPAEHGIVVERSEIVLDQVMVADAEFGLWILDSVGVEASNVNITGHGGSWFGVLVQTSRNVTLRDVQASDLGDPLANIGNGVEFRDSPGAVVQRATVDGAGSNAFRVAGGDIQLDDWSAVHSKRGLHVYAGGGSITRGTISDVSEHGMVIEATTSIHVAASVRSAQLGAWILDVDDASARLDVADTVATGVLIERSTINLAASRIEAAPRGLHAIDADVQLRNSTITNTTGDGIVVEGGGNVTIDGNDVSHGNIGIWVRGSPGLHATIANNTVHHERVSGISLDAGATGVLVDANTLHDNRRGIKLNDGSVGNTLRANHVTNNDHGIWVQDTGASNDVLGGVLGDNRGCDVVALEPDTRLLLAGVTLLDGADAHNRSQVDGQRLKECKTAFDAQTGQIIDTVHICHKPGTPAQKTLHIPATAWPGHADHGDTIGACGEPHHGKPHGDVHQGNAHGSGDHSSTGAAGADEGEGPEDPEDHASDGLGDGAANHAGPSNDASTDQAGSDDAMS